MNNELSIYREVLRFPCDILDLQKKLDGLIVFLRMMGYDVRCQYSISIEGNKCFRISFIDEAQVRLNFHFFYDNEEEYIDIFRYYYVQPNNEVEIRVLRGNEVVEMGEMFDKFVEIM